MEFGKLLAKARHGPDMKGEPELYQSELANRAGVSVAMISAIERGRELPTDQLTEKLIAALKLHDRDRQKLKNALEQDRKAKTLAAEQKVYAFGAILREALESIDVDRSYLIDNLGWGRSTVGLWLQGVKLPGDEFIKEKLLPFLKKKGTSQKATNSIVLAHLESVLARSLDLDYLNEHQQRVLRDAVISKAREMDF